MSRILIADDEAVIAFELEATLSAMGYEVVGTAGSGEEAVVMADSHQPDLVLMDIMMPGDLDGIAAAEKIRAASRASVIFLTAYAGEQYVERAKHVGPCGYLVKPFRDDQIRAAIEIALYRKKLEQRLDEHQRLNELLLDSLPHPAMLIDRRRVVLAANRMARNVGTLVDDYCWRSFGKCAYISEDRKQYLEANADADPPAGTQCYFCLADNAMSSQRPRHDPCVESFGRQWDTHWVPVDDQVYLHYAIDVTEHKQLEASLRKSREELETRVAARTVELKALSAKLLEVQESERKQIASDLHDSIGQILAAIKFGVENAIHDIKTAQYNADLSVLQALVPVTQQACEEVRRLHTNLRPPLLDDIGIVATINWFCREMEALCGGIRIRKQVDAAESRVPPDLKITIFRILQEAMNNAIKHADPKTIDVILDGGEDRIELTILDDGRGFDPQEQKPLAGGRGGYGLNSMRERAHLSGGSFSVQSKPGEGTLVRVAWPAGA